MEVQNYDSTSNRLLPKQWKEHRRRKSILKDIKEAKDIYLRHRSKFMCVCFSAVSYKKYGGGPNQICERIPEFNREFLNVIGNPLFTVRGGHQMIENHVLKHLISFRNI